MNKLNINLKQYHFFWYDLEINPFKAADYFEQNTKELIIEKLKEIKQFNHRFIYFICSRERIRFNCKKEVIYKPSVQDTIVVPLLIGSNAIEKDICISFKHPRQEKCSFELSEKHITITDESGCKETADIHNFLKKSKVKLGFSSKVEYVGFTINPDTRPINGSHSGLSRVLYNLLTTGDNKDIVLYFNEFIVRDNQNKEFNFLEKTKVGKNNQKINIEESIIEKSFIFYFDSINQNENRIKEKGELINAFRNIIQPSGFDLLYFDYEVANKDEYTSFYSDNINPSQVHNFSVGLRDGELEIIRNLNSTTNTELPNFMDKIWTVIKKLE